MAVNLSGSLRMSNEFTPVLQSIAESIGAIVGSLHDVQQAVPQAFDPSSASELESAARDAKEAMDSIQPPKALGHGTREARELRQAIRDVKPPTEQNEQAQREHNQQLQQGDDAAKGILRTLGGIIGLYTIIRGVKLFVETADQVTAVHSRLALMNDDLQSTAELNQMIFESAQRSRGAYLDTAGAVASLGQQTGDLFDTNAQLIEFAEVLNKQFSINQTPLESQRSAMLQLTQALGSGVLRGEEFNAIFEAAPSIIRLVADEMGVSVGMMRSMAAEGEITADIVKNALLNAVEETNAEFEMMPKTWQQVWQSFKNESIMALAPVMQLWNRVLNSEVMIGAVEAATNAVRLFADGLFIAGMVTEQVLMWAADNWWWLEGVIWTVGVAVAFVLGQMLVTALIGVAKAAVTAAVALLGTYWPILVIGAAIGLLIWLFNQWGITAQQVGGFIGGVLMLISAVFYNAIVEMYNLLVWFVEMGINNWNTLGYYSELLFWAIENGWQGMTFFMQTVFADMINSVIGLFETLVNRIIGGINWIVDAMNGLSFTLPDWMGGGEFGFNLSRVNEVSYARVAYPDASGFATPPPQRPEAVTLEREELMDYRDAWRIGNELGQGVVTSIGDAVTNAKDQLKNAMDLNPLGEEMPGGPDGELGDIGGDAGKALKDTAKNTKGINDELKRSNEQLGFLKDLATARSIANVTWEKLEVNVQNSFGDVHKDADLDGWIDNLNEKLDETVNSVAIGTLKDVKV